MIYDDFAYVCVGESVVKGHGFSRAVRLGSNGGFSRAGNCFL